MEPEGSLPHSQVPANCPYPVTARCSPYPPHPTSWRSFLILSSHLRLGLPSGLFTSGFATKTFICLSSLPYALHVLPISFFSILSPGVVYKMTVEFWNNYFWTTYNFIRKSTCLLVVYGEVALIYFGGDTDQTIKLWANRRVQEY